MNDKRYTFNSLTTTRSLYLFADYLCVLLLVHSRVRTIAKVFHSTKANAHTQNTMSQNSNVTRSRHLFKRVKETRTLEWTKYGQNDEYRTKCTPLPLLLVNWMCIVCRSCHCMWLCKTNSKIETDNPVKMSLYQYQYT